MHLLRSFKKFRENSQLKKSGGQLGGGRLEDRGREAMRKDFFKVVYILACIRIKEKSILFTGWKSQY